MALSPGSPIFTLFSKFPASGPEYGSEFDNCPEDAADSAVTDWGFCFEISLKTRLKSWILGLPLNLPLLRGVSIISFWL